MIKTIKYYTVWISNFLLAVVYVIGGMTIIAPTNSIIPQYYGSLAVGTLLLMVGLLGSPFCIFGVES